METYMMMLYVSLEQEKALKQFFLDNNWEYCKPDLSALTDNIGPIVAQVPHTKKPPANQKPSNISPRATTPGRLKSPVMSQISTRSTSLSEITNADTSTVEPHMKKRKLFSSQGPVGQTSKQTSVDGEITSPGTLVNLDGTMTVDEPVSEATDGSTVMDSLSEENRSNDDPTEWEMFNNVVQSSKQADSGKQKRVKVYKVKHKGDKSVQCEEEESGDSKVFRIPVVVKKEIFSCDFCDKTFTIQRHLKNHCKREHDVSIETDYSMNSEADAKLYNCDQCDCSYTRVSSLKKHQKFKHDATFEQKPFTCDICGGKYETQHFLDLHQADKHSKVVGEHGSVVHECKYCQLTFKTFRALRLHKRHHETHCNHVCEVCGKGFLRMDSLKSHHKFVHQGVKRYTLNNGEKRFVCEICGNRFFRRSNLKEHTLVKHSNEPFSHQCKDCEKTFIRPSALEYHVNKIHLNQRPYTCDKCQKQFYSRHSMHDHKTLCNMTPDKKIGCEQCGKLFTSQHNYKLHFQAVHSSPALTCPCGTIVRWQSSVTKHKRRCSLYNSNKQKGRKKQLKLEPTETRDQGQLDNVVYLQDTYSEESVLSEMATNDEETTTTVMVSEAEPDVAESVGRLLEAIPQDALGEGVDKQNMRIVEEQVTETGETTFSNVSVVTEEGQDAQKVYYVISLQN